MEPYEAVILFAALIYIDMSQQYLMLLHEEERQRQHRRRAIAICMSDTPQPIIKSGIYCNLIMDMDDRTFQRHLRLNRDQFQSLNRSLGEGGMSETPNELGGLPRIPLEIKTLMFLWYMANNNSFRELSDKFNVAQGTAHDVIKQALCHVCNISDQFIKWPTLCDQQRSIEAFNRLSGQESIIGAIDGCHIRIQRPPHRGLDYLNRKAYFSMLLQGICNEKGKFIDIFVGPPGRVHDARMLRLSPFFQNWNQQLGNNKLLGDSAYVSQDFPFIITPKRNNGRLTDHDKANNTRISRGRVIIENVFGRLKCRFRRVRDVQNVNLLIMVKLMIAACTLHNMCIDDDTICPEHPNGCPRYDDDNE